MNANLGLALNKKILVRTIYRYKKGEILIMKLFVVSTLDKMGHFYSIVTYPGLRDE
jgi:hypothetical protein